MAKMTLEESQFVDLMRQVVHEVVTPSIQRFVEAEVNRQMKQLTATLVAGLIKK